MTLQEERQLTLVRFPGDLLVGPARAVEPVEIQDETWTEIAGMSVSCSLRSSKSSWRHRRFGAFREDFMVFGPFLARSMHQHGSGELRRRPRDRVVLLSGPCCYR